MIVEGTILRGERFDPIEGRLILEDGHIEAIEETPVESESIALPAFVNAHTHLGDSIAKDAGAGLSLEELVAPPDGLKHRLLRTASRERLIAGMERSLRLLKTTGSGTVADFREGGIEGVTALQEAASAQPVDAISLGRDDPGILEVADGVGASGAADGEFGSLRRAAKEAGKPFGIHAGEAGPGDLHPALDLAPDFLVHAVAAETVHLERIEDSQTPVVVCPRANATLGVGHPPIEELVDRTTVGLGTDNVMLTSPSIFREMEYIEKIATVEPETVLRMATANGASILGLNRGILEEGKEAKVLVLDGSSDNLIDSQDLVRSIVRRASPMDVEQILL